jgi:hypothetical protein
MKPATEPAPRTTGHRVCVQVVQDKGCPKYRVVIGLYRFPTLAERSTYRVAIGFYRFPNPTYRVVCFAVFLYTCKRLRNKNPLFCREERNYSLVQDQRSKRRDAGIHQVTERDIFALTWIAEQYCISVKQLQRLLGRYPKATTKTPDTLSLSATRHAVERWLHLELIEPPRKILATHTPYLWLSRRGLAHLNLPYSYYQPKPSILAHLDAMNRIRLYVERFSLPTTWYSRRLLSRMSQSRPTPDAELHAGATIIAVQLVERLPLPALTLKEEIDTLQQLAARNYSSFWYFLHTETVASFRQALLPLDRELQERVVFSALDAQEEEARAHLDRLAQPTTQDSTV